MSFRTFEKACPECGSTSIVVRDSEYLICGACDARFKKDAFVKPQLRIGEKKRYFVTCAIEGQSLHTAAWRTVQRYCKEAKAELIVIPVSYYRPSNKDRLFAKSLKGLIVREDVRLCKTLIVRGTININPTMQSPLNGLALAGHGDSFIVASPVIHQLFFKSSKYKTPCQMTTTGAITEPRYTRSRFGALGEEHHACGGVIVEVEDAEKHFHLRHIGFSRNGQFTDLHVRWTDEGPKAAPRGESVDFGDLHSAVRVKTAYDAQFAAGGLVTLISPKNVTVQDAFHGASVHRYQNTFERIAEKKAGTLQSLEAELLDLVGSLRLAAESGATVWVIEGNHDRWLDSHLRAQDMWRYSGDSELVADFYMAMLAAAREGEVKLALHAYMNQHFPAAQMVPANGTCVIGDVEHGFHGDRGLRGTKGSLVKFASLGTKTTSGHVHSPGRLRGAISVGTCGPLVSHNSPHDAQMHTHCVQYADNKRTLVSLIDGKFRREDAISARWDKLAKRG